jgi:hypothetical protein
MNFVLIVTLSARWTVSRQPFAARSTLSLSVCCKQWHVTIVRLSSFFGRKNSFHESVMKHAVGVFFLRTYIGKKTGWKFKHRKQRLDIYFSPRLRVIEIFNIWSSSSHSWRTLRLILPEKRDPAQWNFTAIFRFQRDVHNILTHGVLHL